MAEPRDVPVGEGARNSHLDCELYLSGRNQALLSTQGREYSGCPRLDDALCRELLALELDAEAYGTTLFHSLFPGAGDELLIGYRDSLTIARQGHQPMRLRLHLSPGVRQLHELRWELLYDPYRRVFLARSGEVTLSRYLSVAADPPHGVVEGPRILLAVACPDDLDDFGLPTLDRLEIEKSVEEALFPLTDDPLTTKWHIDTMDGPVTAGNLRDRLLRGGYHAVHLLAHGVLSSRQDTASLALQGAEGKTELVDERLLAEIFEGHHELRLVSLVACNSGRSAGVDAFSGLGPLLVRGGIPAVVAMGRQITVSSAADFSRHFYLNLARGQAIDTAVNEARLQLHLASPDSSEWSVPTLFMRLQEGRLWVQPSVGDRAKMDFAGEGRQGERPSASEAATAEVAITEFAVSAATFAEGSNSTKTELKTLLVSDLVDSTHLAEELGDQHMAQIWRRHDRLARDLLHQHNGCEANRTDGFLMLFDRPLDAVCYALDFQQAMADLSKEENVQLLFRVGIHLGEVILIETPAADVARGAKPLEVEGLAKPVTARLMSLAGGGQTILSRTAFDLARRSAVGSASLENSLRWVAHGDYLLKGVTTQMAVYEVGVEGTAPFVPPADGEKVRRAPEDGTIIGWRPALGQEIPLRRHWQLKRKLGEGGFGDVWLAHHHKTGESRVFKFCFEVEQLKALRREITLFRLLKETLGERQDIARILDWSFDEQPFYIEAEYTSGGSLVEWAQGLGGVENIPLADRLEIVAQIGDALAAAHSVGVLHKDVKPANILIQTLPDGRPRARLTDFGISRLSDTSHLLATGITVLDLTELSLDNGSASGGTRLYMAPEVAEGRASSVQADIYALGVVLYQLLVGEFQSSPSPGWEREIEDPLLQQILARACDGNPQRRMADGGSLANRLRTLEERRAALQAEEEARLEAERVQVALARAQRRRSCALRAVGVLAVVAIGLGTLAMLFLHQRRLAEQATEEALREKARAMEAHRHAQDAYRHAKDAQDFLVDIFGLTNPQETPVHSMTVRAFLRLAAGELMAGLKDPRTRARLQSTLGDVYVNLGLFEDAQEILQAALETQQTLVVEKKLTVQDPDMEITLTRLGALAFHRGDYVEAKKFFADLLVQKEARFGSEDHRLAEPLNNLAVVNDLLGESDEALALYERMLAIDRQHLKKDDPELAAGLSNLGLLYNDRQEYVEAEPYHREAIEHAERTLESNHPALPNYLDGLAANLFHTQRYEEALPVAQRALKIRLEVLGPDSTKVANSYNLIARILRDWQDGGDWVEAERLFLEAHRLWMAAEGGAEHQFFGMSLRELAILYQKQGSHRLAESLLRQSLAILRKSSGDDHPETRTSLEALIPTLRALGKEEEIETLEEQMSVQDGEAGT